MDCTICNKDVVCRPCLQNNINRITDLIKYWTKAAENARDLLNIHPADGHGIYYDGKAVGLMRANEIMERVFKC